MQTTMESATTPSASAPRITTYEAFWPFYLDEHSRPLTRVLHFIGTTLVVVLLVVSVLSGAPALLVGLPFAGYGFAWVSHFVVEKNKPASFKYPLWSFVSDWRMWALMWRGKLWTTHAPAVEVGARR